MRRVTVASFIAWQVASIPAAAQQPAVLHGVVFDSVSWEPLSHVSVRLLGREQSGSSVVRSAALTDSAGRFHLPSGARPAGTLEIRRIGFAPVNIVLDSSFAAETVFVALARTAALLGEVRVVASSALSARRLDALGFAARRKAGTGHFLDSAEVVRSNAQSLVELLRPYLKGCTMIFVNGGPGRLGDVSLSTVIGVEIYASNTEAPPNFRNPTDGGGRCGSIAVWR